MMGTATPTRTDFDRQVREQLEDDPGGADFDGWYCVRTNPFPCPAEGCDFVATHMTAAHLIVVWPSSDDRMLLTYARDARKLGRNPKIEEYRREFGSCIPYDAWRAMGSPVHGIREAPEGWHDAWERL